MAISIRDEQPKRSILGSEKGQGIIEYVLILIVVVSIILGFMHQFNSSFQVWAKAYFGDYLSCLLETGELPMISGAPGDSGECNDLFQAFSFTAGRPPVRGGPGRGGGGGSGGEKKDDPSGGTTDVARGGGGYSRIGGGSGRRFGGSSTSAGTTTRSKIKNKDAVNTGNTNAQNAGTYAGINRKMSTSPKYQLDNRFAFEDEKEARQKTKAAASTKSSDRAPSKKRTKLNPRAERKPAGDAPDSGLTLPSFLKYLIIAGILIALFIFLGGQMLNIGKSME